MYIVSGVHTVYSQFTHCIDVICFIKVQDDNFTYQETEENIYQSINKV